MDTDNGGAGFEGQSRGRLGEDNEKKRTYVRHSIITDFQKNK